MMISKVCNDLNSKYDGFFSASEITLI